jgi:hypothetical protein
MLLSLIKTLVSIYYPMTTTLYAPDDGAVANLIVTTESDVSSTSVSTLEYGDATSET